ncbi:MAG: AAA family ATPase [Thermomicrobiales bacterium]|nr:AAA family ATPase [Thermomicrobiales bacterium]
MFLLINGSFGIGKTTVANLLARSVPGAVIYDPERVGFVLRRLPAWTLGLSQQPPDYQDLAIWRRLIAGGARRKHRRAHLVMVPMAFTNLAYLDGFAQALSTTAPVHRVCLIAPLAVVRERLTERANSEGRDITEFEFRRSQECVVAHRDLRFGVPIDATKEPAEIVADIRKELGL